MKFFAGAQSDLAKLGLSSNQWNLNHHHRFNTENILALLAYSTGSILAVLFLVFEAKTIDEFADSMYITCTIIAAGSNIATKILNKKQIFAFIENYEKAIVKRM